MTDFVYDEDLLIDKLEKLPARLRVTYAATCTERLFPAYERYHEKSPKMIEHNLEALLERLWLDVSGEPMSDSEVENGIDECMNEIQDINDSDWIDEAAEGAASSLCYALRCRKSGEAQEAAWATRPLYDTLDHFVINKEDIDINEPGAEDRVLAHPLMQAELARQHRDLEELLLFENENIVDLVSRLRQRAKTEAHMFFGG
jgi:hypothetical protein